MFVFFALHALKIAAAHKLAIAVGVHHTVAADTVVVTYPVWTILVIYTLRRWTDVDVLSAIDILSPADVLNPFCILDIRRPRICHVRYLCVFSAIHHSCIHRAAVVVIIIIVDGHSEVAPCTSGDQYNHHTHQPPQKSIFPHSCLFARIHRDVPESSPGQTSTVEHPILSDWIKFDVFPRYIQTAHQRSSLTTHRSVARLTLPPIILSHSTVVTMDLEALLNFSSHDVEFAFPTRTVHVDEPATAGAAVVG